MDSNNQSLIRTSSPGTSAQIHVRTAPTQVEGVGGQLSFHHSLPSPAHIHHTENCKNVYTHRHTLIIRVTHTYIHTRAHARTQRTRTHNYRRTHEHIKKTSTKTPIRPRQQPRDQIPGWLAHISDHCWEQTKMKDATCSLTCVNTAGASASFLMVAVQSEQARPRHLTYSVSMCQEPTQAANAPHRFEREDLKEAWGKRAYATNKGSQAQTKLAESADTE